MSSLVNTAGSQPRRSTAPATSFSSRPWLPATEIMRLFARYRGRQLDRQRPMDAQHRQLLNLVSRAKDTRFGRDHGFAGINSVAAYQSRVPLRTYNQHWNDYWKADFPRLIDCTWPGTMPYFAVSSGTSTGQVKHIPCSQAMVESNKRAARDILVHHMRYRPHSRLLDGKFFVLGGSTDFNEVAPGIYAGDISGIAAANVPFWAQSFYFPGRDLTFISDWEEKIDRLVDGSAGLDFRFLSGAPGWIAILFEKMAEKRGLGPARVADLMPNLEMLVHGGVSFKPYRDRFAELLEGSNAETREVYPASEAFVAIADKGPGEGMRLNLDHGLFYEFIPVEEIDSPNPTRHWIANVKTGIDYAIALTTCAGLWSYVIGDVVRFVDLQPPRLLVTGRTSYMLSAFGEHVTGELVETAVLAAAAEIGARLSEFAVGSRHTTERGGNLGHHTYVVEFTEPASGGVDRERFTDVVDRVLAEKNEDYRERRALPLGLAAPEVRFVEPGTFAEWMKSRGKLGGQHKVPRVIPDSELLDHLLAFIARS